MTLDAVFEYEVPGLLVDIGLCGQRTAIPGTNVAVLLPTAQPQESEETVDRWFSHDPLRGQTVSQEDSLIAVAVNALILIIPTEVGDLDLTDGLAVNEKLNDQRLVADKYFISLMDWLRSGDRQTMESSASASRTQIVSTHFRKAEGQRLDYGSFHFGPIIMRNSDQAVTVTHFDRVLRAVGSGGVPPVWESLLADVRAAHEVHHQVLLAAIACEVAVKSILKERATEQQRPLIELLLEKPRDFSMAAASLFDRPCLIVLGRSLKEDDNTLFKAVERLFQDRNKIAHSGGQGVRDTETLRTEVSAARDAVSWLEGESHIRVS